MPKRPPTPETDEEHKYLIIHYPYPLHADMNEPDDVRTAALWVACVVGPKYLYAIYYKPKVCLSRISSSLMTELN